jgi:hypothetical protein
MLRHPGFAVHTALLRFALVPIVYSGTLDGMNQIAKADGLLACRSNQERWWSDADCYVTIVLLSLWRQLRRFRACL